MRSAPTAAIALFALLCSAPAQQPADSTRGFRPDMCVLVSEHSTGADMVEITATAMAYPKDLLRDQAKAIGDILGAPARGLQAYEYPLDPGNPRMTLIKASFATNGLIDRESGILRLEPIAKAFAGAPEEHRVTGISIIFQGEKPNDRTIQRFESDAVKVEGEFPKALGGIEYRVTLRTQEPAKIKIPEAVEPAVPPISPKNNAAPRTDWLIWTLLAVAALAVGLLVYWTLLRISARGR